MINIDPEFQALIPPLTADEYTQLEKNILKDGIRDPLVVWKTPSGNEILVDGHNRKRIAEAHPGITYEVKYMEFDLRKDAIRWIILNQFGRRNLSAYDRSLLALKLKPVIAEKAKEQQSSHTEQGYQKSDKAVHTAKELAKVAGVSHDTIARVETIEKKADETTKQQVRSGEKSINQAYNEIKAREIKRMPTAQEYADAAQKRHEAVADAKTVNIEDIQQDRLDKIILENAANSKVKSMEEAVSRLYAQASNGELNINILSEPSRLAMIGTIAGAIKTLENIRAMIEGK